MLGCSVSLILIHYGHWVKGYVYKVFGMTKLSGFVGLIIWQNLPFWWYFYGLDRDKFLLRFIWNLFGGIAGGWT